MYFHTFELFTVPFSEATTDEVINKLHRLCNMSYTNIILLLLFTQGEVEKLDYWCFCGWKRRWMETVSISAYSLAAVCTCYMSVSSNNLTAGLFCL